MKIISLFKDYSIYSQYVSVLLCATKGIQVKQRMAAFLIFGKIRILSGKEIEKQ